MQEFSWRNSIERKYQSSWKCVSQKHKKEFTAERKRYCKLRNNEMNKRSEINDISPRLTLRQKSVNYIFHHPISFEMQSTGGGIYKVKVTFCCAPPTTEQRKKERNNLKKCTIKWLKLSLRCWAFGWAKQTCWSDAQRQWKELVCVALKIDKSL